jgi:RimJ/RimL family protein N-acetyltransferase
VRFEVEPGTPGLIAERATWRYAPPYDFYDDDGIPPNNPEWFYGVRDEDGDLVGFYFFAPRGDATFYGLGLRPDLTGRGIGRKFVERGVEYARSQLGAQRIVLDVAAFNERALKVYGRAGFHRTGSHTRTFERWGELKFIDLELPE